MQHNKVLILDFGSQYTQLIARRVRELNIYCEIHPYNKIPSDSESFKAVVLSGSPVSVRAEDALHPDLSQIRGKRPMLAVCYGAQYLAHFSGGEVAESNTREYGRANLAFIKHDEDFFENIHEGSQVWMSHSDTIKKLPKGGVLLASTNDVENAVKDVKAGKIEFRVDKTGIVHTSLGKLSFNEDQLVDNAKAFLNTIIKMKPASSKGIYVRSLFLSSTMGPGLKISKDEALTFSK